MATPALSLVGFLDQPSAFKHLREACMPADSSDAALTAEWMAARGRLGPVIPSAGVPDIRAIPASHDPYMQQLIQAPWLQPALQTVLNGATFQLVEIDPLLAYQFTIDTARSAHHCGTLSTPPTLDEMLAICLPHAMPSENLQIFPGPNQQSMILKSRSLNLKTLAQGYFQDSRVGIAFGLSLPLLHVVRFNGRCYLHNGFHRAWGLRMAGATHLPCLLRDVASHDEIGIRADGSTFGATLLESDDPPTLGHFTSGRALAVTLRSISRVIHVSWSEYAIPDE